MMWGQGSEKGPSAYYKNFLEGVSKFTRAKIELFNCHKAHLACCHIYQKKKNSKQAKYILLGKLTHVYIVLHNR